MTLAAILFALASGGVVGLVSGLLGIGGGILLVPILYLMIANPDWSGVVVGMEHEAAVAHATSLLVILPTTLTGLWFYRRHGAIDWKVITPMGIAAIVTAPIGARVAVALPSPILKLSFGALLLFAAWQTLRKRTEAKTPSGSDASRRLSLAQIVVGGCVIGIVSALMGIGGGVVAIPILLHWARMEVGRIAPASLGVVAFAAPAGILSYVLAGGGVAGLPPEAFGYLHLPLALALIPGAVLMAPVGVRLNRRLPVGVLRTCFAVLMLVVAVLIFRENLPLVMRGS